MHDIFFKNNPEQLKKIQKINQNKMPWKMPWTLKWPKINQPEYKKKITAYSRLKEDKNMNKCYRFRVSRVTMTLIIFRFLSRQLWKLAKSNNQVSPVFSCTNCNSHQPNSWQGNVSLYRLHLINAKRMSPSENCSAAALNKCIKIVVTNRC